LIGGGFKMAKQMISFAAGKDCKALTKFLEEEEE